MNSSTEQRLKNKNSWIGTVVRNAIAQGALTAKAAVDAIRERIDGPSAPMLIDSTNQPEKTFPSPDSTSSKRRRRQSQSMRNRLSSIRARLPRRSLDQKRYASAETGYPDRLSSTPASRSMTLLAAKVPLPSSPIDMPGKTHLLSVDLGSSHLMSPEQNELDIQKRNHIPAISPALLCKPLARILTPELVDPVAVQLPVPEARQSQMVENHDLKVASVEDGWRTVDVVSPIPESNSRMEMDENAGVLPMRPLSHCAAIMTTVIAATDSHHDSKSAQGRCKRDSVISAPAKGNTSLGPGVPSPCKVIVLPLRPKSSIEATSMATPVLRRIESRSDGFRDSFSTGSPRSRKTPRPVARGRQPGITRTPRSVPDLTTALLRERTDDNILLSSHLNILPIVDADDSPRQAYRQLQQSSSCSAMDNTPNSGRQSDRLSLASQQQASLRARPSFPAASSSSSPIKSPSIDFSHGFRHDSSSPASVMQYYATHNRLSLLTNLDDSGLDTGSDSDLPLFHY